MTENAKNRNIKSFLIKTFFDPVLIYVALIVSSVMYHYRDSLALIYGITSYIIGWFIFRLFDYMTRHKFIGTVGYILVTGLFLRLMDRCIQKGTENYPISFPIWFMTPQDSLQYNKWYTLAMFLFFFIFMASVFYFFTRVRYRVFMTFLIMIVPFSIYGKEYEEMPIGYIISLAVGYIVILTYFRQLNGSKDTIIVDKLESWKSGIIFTAIFAIIASVIPKPEIEADRTVLETLINADAFTDKLVEMLNVFRDTANGQQFRGQTNDNPLYYANSPEPLRLKTSTFSNYDYKTDSWSLSDMDNLCYTFSNVPFDITMNGELCDAVFYAAGLDSDFAETYGLSEYSGFEFIYPERKEISIFSSYQDGTRTPVPQSVSEMLETSYKNEIMLSRSGNVISSSSTERFAYNENFRYNYLPDGFFDNEQNKKAVDVLGRVENYSEMLHSAYDIIDSMLDETYASDENYDILNHYWYVLNTNLLYDSFEEILLDYGDNKKIFSLAHDITSGLDSDYDKAKAIEWYFILNGYVYDLDYRKEAGENAEDFLFDTKTGVCYEYATAMTLLARASGIPARYCEGFNMHTKYNPDKEDDSLYVITARDAHGFPELYIKGFGWVSFEPTMTSANTQVSESERQAVSLLSKTGILLLTAAVFVLVLIFFMPVLVHRFFIFVNKRRNPNKAVLSVIHRICRLYGISASSTAHEAERAVKSMSGADISDTALIFEKAEYGGEELTEIDKADAMRDYVSAYDALKELKRASGKRKSIRNK